MDPTAALSAAGYPTMSYPSYADLAMLSNYASAYPSAAAAAAMLPNGPYPPAGLVSSNNSISSNQPSIYNPFPFDPRTAAAIIGNTVGNPPAASGSSSFNSMSQIPPFYPPYPPSGVASGASPFPLGLLGPRSNPGNAQAAAAAALLIGHYQAVRGPTQKPPLTMPSTTSFNLSNLPITLSVSSAPSLVSSSSTTSQPSANVSSVQSGASKQKKKEEENERKRREYLQVMKSRTESLVAGALGTTITADPGIFSSLNIAPSLTSLPSVGGNISNINRPSCGASGPPPSSQMSMPSSTSSKPVPMKITPLQEGLNKKRLSFLSSPAIVRAMKEMQHKTYVKKWTEEGFPNVLNKKIMKT